MSSRITKYNTQRWLSVLLITILFSIQARATAVIVFISKQGISIATDSKITVIGGEAREGSKCFIVQGRLAIASLGTDRLLFSQKTGPPVMDYEFGAWVHRIEGGLRANTSFDAFVATVTEEVRKMVPQWQSMVNVKGITRRLPADMIESPVHYVIAGYQDGVPKLSVVEIYINWETNSILGPYQVPIEPKGPSPDHTRGYMLGITQVAVQVGDPQSYAYKQTAARSPKALKELVNQGTLSLEESSALARDLVEVEQETNPKQVGGTVRVIEIAPTGKARDLVEGQSAPGTAR